MRREPSIDDLNAITNLFVVLKLVSIVAGIALANYVARCA